MDLNESLRNTSSQAVVNPLHFFMLPNRADDLIFEEGIAVYSSLDTDFEESASHTESSDYLSYPVRVMMLLVVVCRNGWVRVRCNLEEYVVQEGEMLIILPGYTLESLIFCQPNRYCLIALTKDMATEMVSLQNSMLGSLDFVRPIHLKMSELQIDFLIQLFRMLRCCADMPVGEERRSAVGACARLLSCQMNLCNQSASHTEEVSRPLRCNTIYTQFVRDVMQHFREHRDMQFYADRQFITPKYLGSAVLRASGRHAYKIICDQVILEAKILLCQPDITILRVSMELNFPNHSFFSKFFKAHTGLTPQEFLAGRRTKM